MIPIRTIFVLPLLGFGLSLIDRAPHGQYVEARSASVFAGACHFGGEATTAGREALLAWHFDGGVQDGVPLAGVDVVAVVAGEANLAQLEPARRTILYFSERSSVLQREAVRALLTERLGSTLGTIRETRLVALELSLGAESYSVASPGAFALSGALLPDRACCHMPFQVWYKPLTAVEKPIVGHNDVFRFEDQALGRTWSRPDENSAFAGAFRFVATRDDPGTAAR